MESAFPAVSVCGNVVVESGTEMPTLNELGIDQMSTDERLRLIGDIWDSLSPVEQIELTESQRLELDRRIAAADADPSPGTPWEIVKARSRSRE